MMYSEFLENVGCIDKPVNYQLYKRLELLYMTDDSISKDEIYAYGVKLADNTPTDDMLKYKAINDEHIATLKDEKKSIEKEIAYHKEMIGYYMSEGDKHHARLRKDTIKILNTRKTVINNEIRFLQA